MPEIRCFRCLGTGHHQIDCKNDPVCYKCKDQGHMAVDCKASNAKKVKIFGFGIPGQGFYSLNFPEAKIKTHQSTGLLTILEGEASEEKVDKELKNMVRDKWDFKVKKIHLQEYLVVFPDKGSLETFTKLTEFQMSLYGLKGRLEKTARDSETSSLLHAVWIKIHGVPELAREVEPVKEIVALIAEPLVVDELSLIKIELVRVQGRCRNPAAIRGSIEIFFNGVGKMIRFEVESSGLGGLKGGKGGPPRNDKPDDRKDYDRDKYQKEDKSRKSSRKFDRIGKIDKEADSGHEGSMEEAMEQMQHDDIANTEEVPIAAFHPNVGMISVGNTMDKRGLSLGDPQSNMELLKVPNTTLEFNLESQFIVHGRDGPFAMEKSKWPNLTLPEEEPMEGLTQRRSS